MENGGESPIKIDGSQGKNMKEQPRIRCISMMAQAAPTGNTIDLSAFGQVWSEPWPGVLKRNLQQWVSSALVINMYI